MTHSRLLALGLLSLAIVSSTARGITEAQADYEKSNNAVVRQKHFYKAGKFEVTGVAGVMPYDSLVNHYMLGGRADWHITDHFGWEVADLQFAFPTVTGFTSGLVTEKGLSNLNTVKIRQMASTNLLVSPLYGKVRFFGRQVLYFDVYVVAGGGAARTEVINVHANGINQPSAIDTLPGSPSWDPMFDVGFGFKIFMNDALGLVIDLRDYVINSNTYGSRNFKSNFSVFGGLSFFLPTFG